MTLTRRQKKLLQPSHSVVVQTKEQIEDQIRSLPPPLPMPSSSTPQPVSLEEDATENVDYLILIIAIMGCYRLISSWLRGKSNDMYIQTGYILLVILTIIFLENYFPWIIVTVGPVVIFTSCVFIASGIFYYILLFAKEIALG